MCAKILTSYKETFSVFDVSCRHAETIEAVVPKLCFDRIGIWRILQPYMDRVKTLVTSAEVYDQKAWSAFYQNAALRLISSDPEALPMGVWYFHNATTPSALILGADALLDQGPTTASLAIYCCGPEDKLLISQARRWVREQKKTANAPSKDMIEGRAKLNGFLAIDADVRQLHALDDADQMQVAVDAFIQQLDEWPSPWPGSNVPWPGSDRAIIKYRVVGDYLLKVSYDEASLLFAWSDGAQTVGDSAHTSSFFWNLECPIVLDPAQGRVGLALDPHSGRIFLVQYVDDNAFWTKARWRGVYVQCGEKSCRAVPLTWIGAPHIKQHLENFAFEMLRVMDKLPEKQISQDSILTEEQEDAEDTAEGEPDIFENFTQDEQTKMLRMVCLFLGPLSTRMIASKGAQWIKSTFKVMFQNLDSGELIKNNLNYGAAKGYFEMTQKPGGHRYWTAICKRMADLDDELLDAAVVFACQAISTKYQDDIVEYVKQILQHHLKMASPRGQNVDVLRNAIQTSIMRCLANKIITQTYNGFLKP